MTIGYLPRTLALVSSSLMILSLAGCGKEKSSHPTYPAAYQQTFIEACKKSSDGDEKYCKCSLEKINQVLPFEDMQKYEADIKAGTAESSPFHQKVQEAVSACNK